MPERGDARSGGRRRLVTVSVALFAASVGGLAPSLVARAGTGGGGCIADPNGATCGAGATSNIPALNVPAGPATQGGWISSGPAVIPPAVGMPCPATGAGWTNWKIPPGIARAEQIPPGQITGSDLQVYPSLSGNSDGSVTASWGPIAFQIAGGAYDGFNSAGSDVYTIGFPAYQIPTTSQQDALYLQNAQQFVTEYTAYQVGQIISGLMSGSPIDPSNFRFLQVSDILQHTDPPVVGGTAYADELNTFGAAVTATIHAGRMQPPQVPLLDATGRQVGWKDHWSCTGFSPVGTLDSPILIQPDPAGPTCASSPTPSCFAVWQAEVSWLFTHWLPGRIESMPAANSRTYVHAPTYFWISGSQRPDTAITLASVARVPGSNGNGADGVFTYSGVDITPNQMSWHFGDGRWATAAGRGSPNQGLPSWDGVAQTWSEAPCAGAPCVTHAYPSVSPSVCVYAEQDFAIHYHGYYNPGGGSPIRALPQPPDQLLHVYWPPRAPGDYTKPGCYTLSVDQIQAVPYLP